MSASANPHPVTFYDLRLKTGETSWSPNTFKTRLVLYYKQIPFETIWVNFSEIKTTLKQAGFPPTVQFTEEEGDVWTVPALRDATHDSDEPTLIAESRIIAKYLDEKYPSRPILPSDPKLLEQHDKIVSTFEVCVLRPFFQISLPSTAQLFNAPCAAALNNRYSPMIFGGKSMDEAFQDPEERKALWASLKAAMDIADKEISDQAAKRKAEGLGNPDDEDGPFVFGKHPTFADIVIISHLLMAKIIPLHRDGDVGSVWEVMQTWNDGRWKTMLDAFENNYCPERFNQAKRD